MKTDPAIVQAREVLRIEAESILDLLPKVDGNFSRAVELIYKAKGRVIVAGIGKSGLIGKKIVATLTSTGTPAIFLHPVEGMHGDIGIMTKEDVLLAISNSGETQELNMLLGTIRHIGTPIIAFTGDPGSTLGSSSDIVIDVGVKREACPFGLAPTSSSTAALAMGDALAVALIEKHQFNEKDFFKFHPGGSLGLRLMAKVRDVMLQGRQIPRVNSGSKATSAIRVLDSSNKGFVLVTDRKNHLIGILTDGDVRRLVRKGQEFTNRTIDEIMTRSPKTVPADLSLAKTIESMQRDEITALAVVDKDQKLQGCIHLHDILGRGGTLKISISF